MELLKQRILKEGRSLDGGILKVDSFINHQLDPKLMQAIALEFVQRFQGEEVNKVLTIEASGIAPAIMVGYILGVPVVFAKKKKPNTIDKVLHTKVYSFTKNVTYDVIVSPDFLTSSDRVLFIDDFLANGNAALGAFDLINQSGASLVGMGFVIEKSFQGGREKLECNGIKVESLAQIADLSDCKIAFKE